MELFTFFRSSAAFRVRIALALKELDYTAIPKHFRRHGGEHRQPDFLALNPQGLLPVLRHGDTAITQSLAIIDYLDSQFPEPKLCPDEPIARAKVQALAQVIACDIHPLNNLRVLNYLREELAQDETAITQWVQHWLRLGFEGFEGLIAEVSCGQYCFGGRISIADVCLVPQVYNAQRFDCDLSPFQTIVSIYQHLQSHPAFVKAAPENQDDAE